MQIPRFWANENGSAVDSNGKRYALRVWGWSDVDQASARINAASRLAATMNKIELGSHLDRYGYGEGERPLREQMIQAVPGADALITRNSYGALILNTARVFFADIDLPKPKGGFLAGIFGKKPVDPTDDALARLKEWHAHHPYWSLRVYRTKAGLRLLATHDQFDPTAEDTQKVLASMGSDPLYTILCRSQGCFRARLSPKPWRIGMQSAHLSYPFSDSSQETRFSSWLQKYDAARPRYSVCRLLAELGPRSQTAEAAAVLTIHDRYACSPGDLPLA